MFDALTPEQIAELNSIYNMDSHLFKENKEKPRSKRMVTCGPIPVKSIDPNALMIKRDGLNESDNNCSCGSYIHIKDNNFSGLCKKCRFKKSEILLNGWRARDLLKANQVLFNARIV